MAKMIELPASSVWLLAGPGRTETGAEFAKRIGPEGRKVRFLQWPGGRTVAVTYPATSQPTIHQFMHAYRLSVDAPEGGSST